MNNKIKIILGILIIGGIVTGGFLYYRSRAPRIDKAIVPESKIYKNSKYGFSIAYPAKWGVKENTEQNVIAEFTDAELPPPAEQPRMMIFLTPAAKPINSVKDLENYVNAMAPKGKYAQGTIQKIGNTEAVVVDAPEFNLNYRILVPESQDYYLEIIGGGNNLLYQKIFQSFRLEK